MDLLAIILACSLHPDDALVAALVDVQSGGNPYFVGDLATLETTDSLRSAESALRFAEDLRRRGGRPAVGLLGVPIGWAARYGRAPIELFDACTNVAVATAAFSEYEARCSAASRARRTPSSLRRAPPARRAGRACILALFARDLGLVSAPDAILRRLASHRRPRAHERPGAPRDGLVRAPGPSLFLDAARILPAPR